MTILDPVETIPPVVRQSVPYAKWSDSRGKISGARTVLSTPPRPSPHHAERSRAGMAIDKRTATILSASFQARFWAKVRKSEGCWEWTGCRRQSGHGAVYVGTGVPDGAHRVSFFLAHGHDGYYVCHHCDNPACVRPDHLYNGTPKSNVQDAIDRRKQWNSAKTHCLNGHAFTQENTYISPSRSGRVRVCRTCQQLYQRAHRSRYRETRNRMGREKRALARAQKAASS